MSKKKSKKPKTEIKAKGADKATDETLVAEDRRGFLSRFDNLRREMDEVFSHFSERLDLFGFPASESRYLPIWDVNETDALISISVEMPGIDQSDIDVTVSDSLLRISGKKQSRV